MEKTDEQTFKEYLGSENYTPRTVNVMPTEDTSVIERACSLVIDKRKVVPFSEFYPVLRDYTRELFNNGTIFQTQHSVLESLARGEISGEHKGYLITEYEIAEKKESMGESIKRNQERLTDVRAKLGELNLTMKEEGLNLIREERKIEEDLEYLGGEIKKYEIINDEEGLDCEFLDDVVKNRMAKVLRSKTRPFLIDSGRKIIEKYINPSENCAIRIELPDEVIKQWRNRYSHYDGDLVESIKEKRRGKNLALNSKYAYKDLNSAFSLLEETLGLSKPKEQRIILRANM